MRARDATKLPRAFAVLFIAFAPRPTPSSSRITRPIAPLAITRARVRVARARRALARSRTLAPRATTERVARVLFARRCATTVGRAAVEDAEIVNMTRRGVARARASPAGLARRMRKQSVDITRVFGARDLDKPHRAPSTGWRIC